MVVSKTETIGIPFMVSFYLMHTLTLVSVLKVVGFVVSVGFIFWLAYIWSKPKKVPTYMKYVYAPEPVKPKEPYSPPVVEIVDRHRDQRAEAQPRSDDWDPSHA